MTDEIQPFTLAATLNLLELIQQVKLTAVGGRFILTLDINPRDGESVWITSSNVCEHPSAASDGLELGPVRVTEDGRLVAAGGTNEHSALP